MNLAIDTKIRFHTHTQKHSLYIWVHCNIKFSLYMGPLQYKIKKKNIKLSLYMDPFNIKSRGKVKDLVLLDFPRLIVVDLINI